MTFINEQHYFNGQKVAKHTLEKYLKWEKILTAIKNGADSSPLIKERLGSGFRDMIYALKEAGLIIASNNNRTATYSVSQKGEVLINDVKQHKKEKKNEEN